MTIEQAKKIASKHYGHSNLEIKAMSVLIEAGLRPAKKDTPIMQMIATQINLTRKSLGVR
jgi:hypothetical protein